MRKKISHALSHPLISGSAVIVVGSAIGNAFNFLYTWAMGNKLSTEYGELAALISLFNILVIFSVTVSTVFAKFTAMYVGQGQMNLIGALFRKGSFVISKISIVMSLILILFSSSIASFLHIHNLVLIYMVAVSLFFSSLSAVGNGILQGLLRFWSYSIIYIFSTIVKFVLGITLVFLGLKVVGATLAILISAIFGYVIIFIPLRKYMFVTINDNTDMSMLQSKIIAYSIPVLLSGLGLTMLNTIDIILVKHFFSDIVSSQYAALSLMGRSIFFVVSPIILVFFPLIAQKRERKENITNTVLLSVIIVVVPCIVLSLVYFIFPHIILKIFFPSKIYSSLGPYLGPFSLFIVLYTLCYFFSSFFLSIGKTSVYKLSILASIVEVISIMMFHNSLTQIIYSITGSSFLLLFFLLLYYRRIK